MVNNVFKRILDHLDSNGFSECIHTFYIASESNPADAPSRGQYPDRSGLLPAFPVPSELQHFIIDSVEPLTPSKLRLQRDGHLPAPQAKPSRVPGTRACHDHSGNDALKWLFSGF